MIHAMTKTKCGARKQVRVRSVNKAAEVWEEAAWTPNPRAAETIHKEGTGPKARKTLSRPGRNL